ncbi:MAG: ATP-binding protein [Alphaproteobacteria bacterium]
MLVYGGAGCGETPLGIEFLVRSALLLGLRSAQGGGTLSLSAGEVSCSPDPSEPERPEETTAEKRGLMRGRADTGTSTLAFLAGGGELGSLMRGLDWASTPLGPPETWPQSLRSAVSIMLNSRYPIALYWGPELALVYNDAWSPIPGSKHPWALGRPGREVWPEIWDTIGPLYERVLATGEGVWQEDELLPMHRHGYLEECYYNFTVSPVRGEGGQIDGIFNAVVETTFRVIGERRSHSLRDLADRLVGAKSVDDVCAAAANALAQASADVPFCLLYLLDDSRHARLAGAAGIAPDGPASPTRIDLDDPAAAWPLADVRATAQVAIVGDLARRFEIVLPGGPWPESAQGAMVVPIAGSGGPAGILIAGISPRRALDDEYRAFIDRVAGDIAAGLTSAHAYQAERRRAETLAEIDRAKTAFFSNTSHEFRTPLTLMIGPLEDLLARAASDQVVADKRELELIHRNSLRLLKLSNTLLDFSRIEAGRVQATYEPVDIVAYTAELASIFRSATDKAGLRLVINCSPIPVPVYVDRDMWEKIVLNLVSNAFKYTFEGEIAIILRLAVDESAVVLAVRDTGVGIHEHELPRLFERFHRIEGQRGRTFEGTGIGLAFVQELVKLHGGTVRAESEVGRGTSITVTVPLGKAHLPLDRIGGERTAATTAVGAAAFVEEALRWLPDAENRGETVAGRELIGPLLESLTPLRRPLVLLADDNTDMRNYVERLLGMQYEVEAVLDGQAALEAARRRRPDLVLSDIMMPRLDGFGLVSALRSDPDLREVPVILLPARAGEEASVEGLGAGADDYIAKPFNARELLARVASNLETARIRREAAEELRCLNEGLEFRVAAEVEQRVKFEEAFRQAQKMEAIGQLTGGIAHDFNNLLQVIIGNLDALQRRTENGTGQGDEDFRRLMDAATRGAERAAVLTNQLLAFSRRQPLAPRSVDLNKLVTGLSDLLHRALGETIKVETVLSGGMWRASVDQNQLESALLNLTVNARDAMPNGGKLTIETANVYLDETYAAAHEEVRPGQYALIAVSDNGSGMSKEVLDKAFDPFFTTKEAGYGTGLGLSQVYGFLKQSGGHVKIHSEIGEGTTVKLYFPRLVSGDTEAESMPEVQRIPTGTKDEIILVVEDDDDVRAYTVEMLRELGYTVLEAGDGPAAFRLLQREQSIQLLFTDVGLPGGLNGRQLADRARRRSPNLKVLFTTGYARNAIVHNGKLDVGVALISKPFTYTGLATKVRQVLEAN